MGFGGLNPYLAGLPATHPLLGARSTDIEGALKTTLSRIELDQTRVQQASQHYNAIKDWLESKLAVTVRLVGSFQRQSKVRPIGSDKIDIDALACFGDATYFAVLPGTGVTSTAALQKVHSAMASNKIYCTKDLVVDSPVVTITYESDFSVEIVPCYRNLIPPHAGRNPASYLVGTAYGGWETSDYDYDSAFITQANKDTGGKLVPAIKLLKRFARNNQIALKSFQVEILATLVLVPFIKALQQSGTSVTWSDIIGGFLNLAPLIVGQQLALPGSLSQPMMVENSALVAAHLTKCGLVWSQIMKLPDSENKYDLARQLYGEPFPY